MTQDAEKGGLMNVERLELGLDEEQYITSGIEEDIDQDLSTPSKPKRAWTRRSDARPKSSRNPRTAFLSAARPLLPSNPRIHSSLRWTMTGTTRR